MITDYTCCFIIYLVTQTRRIGFYTNEKPLKTATLGFDVIDSCFSRNRTNLGLTRHASHDGCPKLMVMLGRIVINSLFHFVEYALDKCE